MEEEKEDKGFTVSDKRFSARKEQEPSPQGEKKAEEPAASPKSEFTGGKEEATGERPSAGEQEFPPLNFVTFLLSLNNSVLIHLGELEEPVTGKKGTDLPLARQTIDIIDMLKEKTKGNLSTEEEKLLDDLLYNLRMLYVRKANP